MFRLQNQRWSQANIANGYKTSTIVRCHPGLSRTKSQSSIGIDFYETAVEERKSSTKI